MLVLLVKHVRIHLKNPSKHNKKTPANGMFHVKPSPSIELWSSLQLEKSVLFSLVVAKVFHKNMKNIFRTTAALRQIKKKIKKNSNTHIQHTYMMEKKKRHIEKISKT